MAEDAVEIFSDHAAQMVRDILENKNRANGLLLGVSGGMDVRASLRAGRMSGGHSGDVQQA